MIPVRNSYWLSANLPNAVLLTYPGSGHGSLFQYHESFTRQVTAFLAFTAAGEESSDQDHGGIHAVIP
jgi:pimeloyl-ACP methyl ester carboxylesterase